MNRRSFFSRIAGVAAVAAVPVQAEADHVEHRASGAALSPADYFRQPSNFFHGYYVRGVTDYDAGIRLCPIMPDDEGLFDAKVGAWYTGWRDAETEARTDVSIVPASVKRIPREYRHGYLVRNRNDGVGPIDNGTILNSAAIAAFVRALGER